VPIAFPVACVEEIVRAVALASVPSAPQIIEGILNLRGRLVPVIDVRARLGFSPRAIDPADFLVVLSLGSRRVAVRVDSADDVEDIALTAVSEPGSVSPALADHPSLAGIATRPDGALVLFDPSAFLTQAEADAIDAALVALP
jgi:purine-binding chemotaxis protein CheW